MGGTSHLYSGLEHAKQSFSTRQDFSDPGSSGIDGRLTFTTRWLRLVVHVYKADYLILRTRLSAVLVIFNILIFGILSTNWGRLKQKYTNFVVADWLDLTCRIILTGNLFLTIATGTKTFFYSKEPKSTPDWGTKLFAVCKALHHFLGFPLVLGLYSSDVLHPDTATSIETAWSWLLILLGAAILVPVHLSWSGLPTTYPLSRTVQMTNAILYGLQSVHLALTHSSTAQNSLGFALTTLLVVSLVLFQSVSIISQESHYYWDFSMQTLTSVGVTCVGLLRLAIWIYSLSPPDTPLLTFILITGTVVASGCRATYMLERRKLMRAVEHIRGRGGAAEFTAVWRRHRALGDANDLAGHIVTTGFELEMQQIHRKLLLGGKPTNQTTTTTTTYDVETLPRETMMYQSPRMFSPRITEVQTETVAEDVAQDGSFLWLYYRKILDKRVSKVEDLRNLLIFEVVFMDRCLLELSGHLQSLRKALGNQASKSVDVFVLENLFQGRLEILSESVVSEKAKAVSLDEMMDRLCQDSSEDSGLNIKAALYSKDKYTWMLSDINQLIQTKYHIFKKLVTSTSHKSRFFYNKNRNAQKLFTRVEKQLEPLLSSSSTPSYVLSSAITYYLKLKFDVEGRENLQIL